MYPVGCANSIALQIGRISTPGRICEPYAGEVLVSGPAASMLEGSHLRLEDAGEHELKGLPGRRRVCRLTEASVQARR